MTKKVKALFVEVDVQNDFVSGSLAVAQAVENNRLGNMLMLSEKAPVLIGSVDSHNFQSWEFASNNNKGPSDEDPQFPEHCVVGTWGWLRVQADKRRDTVFIPDVKLGAKDLPGELRRLLGETTTVILQKEVYSLFANPNAERVLFEMLTRSETDNVVVYGIATDYCVKAAVEGLKKYGVRVHIVEDAIAAVDREMGKVLVAQWKATEGLQVIDTKTALERFA